MIYSHMSLFHAIFSSVATLLVISVVGFFILKRKILPEQIIQSLSPLVLEVALPCLVFYNIVTQFNPLEYAGWYQLPLWWLGFTCCSLLLSILFRSVARKDIRREFSMSLFYQNGIFVPVAVLTGMYPGDPTHTVNLFLLMMFYPAFIFNTYSLFFMNRVEKMNWRRTFNSVFIMTVLAILIRLSGTEVFIPGFMLSMFKMLGGLTIPLIMIILGGSLYIDWHNRSRVHGLEVAKFVGVKNIAYPLIFLGLIYLVKPPFPVALLIFIESAVPPISAVPIFIRRAGGNHSVTNYFVVASFVFSLVSIPIMFILFSRMYM